MLSTSNKKAIIRPNDTDYIIASQHSYPEKLSFKKKTAQSMKLLPSKCEACSHRWHPYKSHMGLIYHTSA